MGDFFKGWRPKAGCVMLVLALVFMGGWVRSQSSGDGILFNSVKGGPYFVLVSMDNSIVIASSIKKDSQWELNFPRFESSEVDNLQSELGDEFEWHGRVFGFGWGEIPDELRVWIVPYWIAVITLTLLSAYLLLSKPRSTIPNGAREPTPVEGA